MSRKNVLQVYPIIVNGDMSGNITSAITNIQFTDNIPVQLAWTGAPVGTFSIQGSLNYNPNTAIGTWTALSFTPTPAASGVAGDILFDLNQLSFPYVKVVYTFTSGTGVLQGYIGGKAI